MKYNEVNTFNRVEQRTEIHRNETRTTNYNMKKGILLM